MHCRKYLHASAITFQTIAWVAKLRPVGRQRILTGWRRHPTPELVQQTAGEQRFMLFTNTLHSYYLQYVCF